MAALDDDELAALAIERMVFHIVGPKPEHFQRLEEITPGPFAGFFLDRIRSASRGNAYRFAEHAQTKSRLLSVLVNRARFQEESEGLAEDFQRAHGGQTAPGAFLVFLLAAKDRRAFALLKYDDDTVLTYDLEEGQEGRKRATLASLRRNFVKNPSALQKAALITLDPEPGFLSVLDHRNGTKVARYFETFLGAKREFTDEELTRRIYQAAVDTILENESLVEPDVYREVRRRAYNAAAAGGAVEAQSNKSFLEAVLGRSVDEEDDLATKFRHKLRSQRIENESFRLAPNAVSRPRQRRIETVAGVRIQFAEELQDLVEVNSAEGRIVINDRIRRDDVDSEPNSRTRR